MKKKLVFIIALCGILIFSYSLYQDSLTQSTYLGLPTVPCQDYTKPISQNFSFSLSIQIQGKNYPLDKTIGHDYGKCLHTIFVNDSSGKVYVKANDKNTYTLGQFFDVWRKTFTPYQIGDYQTKEKAIILVNGTEVSTFRNTPFKPNEVVSIIYH